MPITLILGLLPLVPHIVQGMEALFKHQPSSGPTKKQTAISLIGDAANAVAAVQGIPGANSPLMALIETEIEGWVTYFNDSGQFTHSTPSAATTP